MHYQNPSEKNADLLKLSNRKKIYELVRENQGCHFREIERRIKFPYGTLKYHLNFLVRHGLLIESRDKNNTRYYTKELSKDDSKLISLLRQESIRKIILFMITNKNPSYKEIVSFLKLSPSTVTWHLNSLLRKGIIGKKKDSGHFTYFLLADRTKIMSLLISYKKSFLDSLVDRTVEMWDVK